MRLPTMKSLHLLPVFLLDIIVIVAAQTTTSSSTSARSTSDTPATATSKGNRITYAQLPSCASACVASAVRSVPCTPFVASCFCALPTGRRAYELPIECVKEKCGKEDVEAQETWRADVCAGFTETTVIPPPTGIRESSVTLSQSTAPEATESCGNGWKGCPVGLNGGCCPSDNICNLLDCQPSPSIPSTSVTRISSPSEVPIIDVTTLFPPCSHQCIANYLPQTKCSISPLNSTCFCRLHDMLSCFSSCSETAVDTFVADHLEICKSVWFFEPYDPTFDRWCDLVEGNGKRGRPFYHDNRMGSLEAKCPDWWEQRSAGKRFGIVLGIGILSFLFIFGCCGYWKHVAKRVDEIDRLKAREKRELMGIPSFAVRGQAAQQ